MPSITTNNASLTYWSQLLDADFSDIDDALQYLYTPPSWAITQISNTQVSGVVLGGGSFQLTGYGFQTAQSLSQLVIYSVTLTSSNLNYSFTGTLGLDANGNLYGSISSLHVAQSLFTLDFNGSIVFDGTGITGPMIGTFDLTLPDATHWSLSTDANGHVRTLLASHGSQTLQMIGDWDPVSHDNMASLFAGVHVFNGTASNDTLVGGLGNDTLHGSSGNDVFLTSEGQDQLDGGDGSDVLVLPGFANQIAIQTLSQGHYRVSDGTLSCDIQQIEQVRLGSQFSTLVPVDLLANGQAQDQLAKLTDLYLAFFGRAPDVGGLEYWQMRNLQDGRDFQTISKDFAWSVEAQSRFPVAASNRDFVQNIYQNCFGRNPDTGGWDYWTGRLNGLGQTDLNDRGSFVGEMLLGAYAVTSGSTDRELLSNKHDVAMQYVNLLSTHLSEGFDPAINALLHQVDGTPLSKQGAFAVLDHVFSHEITLTGVMSDNALLNTLMGH